VNSFLISVSQAWREAKNGAWSSLSHQESAILKVPLLCPTSVVGTSV